MDTESSEISDGLFTDLGVEHERGYELFKAGDMYVHYLIIVAKDFGLKPMERHTLTWDWKYEATWEWKP